MTFHTPVVIDPHGVGPIIAAVRNAYVHKPVAINPGLDPAALASDIRRAMTRYYILLDMQKGEWNNRLLRGRRLLRAIALKEVEVLLHQDDAGRWWKKALIATATQDEFAAWRGSLPWGVETAEEVAAFHDRVRYLLEDRFVSKGDPRSARTVLGEGSALEWLIRRRPSDLPADESFCLPAIFERHFVGLKARISGTGKMVGNVWHDYTRSPYLSFVIAVLVSEGIRVSPGYIRKAFHGAPLALNLSASA